MSLLDITRIRLGDWGKFQHIHEYCCVLHKNAAQILTELYLYSTTVLTACTAVHVDLFIAHMPGERKAEFETPHLS